MATDLQAKSQPAKHELFVEQQITRVSKRIHAIEVGKALLLLLVITLAYALAMALFDLSAGKDAGSWASVVRVAGIVVYLGAALALLGVTLARLVRRINPYYAARQIEETIPGAKNSVVNWLDLRQTRLPPIIRNALGLRAARDIKTTNPEKAVDARGTWILTGILGGLLVALAILFLTGPNRFGSLLRRAFLPLGDGALTSRTEITLIKPNPGIVTVPLGQKVEFRAEITGTFPRVNTPQAPRLHYQHNKEDPWVPVPLDEDHDGYWIATLQADQVQNGFWYKLTAGDAETEVHQVKVRGAAQASRFLVTYQYRPYVRVQDFQIEFPNQTEVFPRIKALKGTQVTLSVRTNRPLLQARVEVEQGNTRKDLVGEIDADDPQVFRVKFQPEKAGRFRVLFTSRDGEDNSDRSPYPIEIWPDSFPNVVLEKPGQDVSLPANGTLPLEGFVSDDYGIKDVVLRLSLSQGPTKTPLMSKPYRPEKPLRFADGAYPDRLEYKDFIALDQLQNAKGQPFSLDIGMVVEYELHARDNSDYPDKNGNLGKSVAYKINILPPDDPKKAKDERKKAQDDKKKNDKKQDDDLKKQENERNQSKGGDSKTPEQKEREKDLQDKAEKIKDALDKQDKAKQDQEQKQQGEAKGGDDSAKAEDKKAGDNPPETQPKGDNKAGNDQPGQKKDGGEQGDMKPEQKAGQSKDAGPKDQKQQPDTGEAKGPGQDKPPTDGAKGADNQKGPEPKNQPDKATAKDQPRDSPGNAKDLGDKTNKENNPSGAKDSAPGDSGQSSAAKDQKPGGDGPMPQAKDDKKGEGAQDQARGDSKPAAGDQPASQEKQSGGADKGERGQAKDPGPAQERDKTLSRAKGEDEIPEISKSKDLSEDKTKAGAEPARSRDSKTPPTQDQAKSSEPAKNKDVGKSRDNGEQELKDAQARDATPDDVKRLKDRVKKEGPTGDDAAETLERLAKNAKDPKVRQAAEDALKEAGHEPGKTAQNSSGDPKSNKIDPNKGEPKGNSQGPSTKTGPGGSGFEDKFGGTDADPIFGKRAGDLNLNELKDKVTPDILKKAGLTEKDWDQFQKDARAYQEMLQKQRGQAKKADPLLLRGDPALLPNVGPRLVEGANQTASPTQSGQGLPPPEFREKYYRWTIRPQEKK